jgi:preprotein translocase subunit SecD
MTKISNASAYFSRLQQLAEVNKSGVKKTNNFGLGTLIDSKRTLDGVAYGIVKENHHYYIKKGGLKENLDVSDFTYIGGIANITEYQYNSLAEADKKRNMMLNVLNESTKVKSNLSKTKLNENEVKEDVVDDKFNSMNKSVNKLDVATATEKQKASTPPQANVPDLSDEQPIPDADEVVFVSVDADLTTRIDEIEDYDNEIL